MANMTTDDKTTTANASPGNDNDTKNSTTASTSSNGTNDNNSNDNGNTNPSRTASVSFSDLVHATSNDDNNNNDESNDHDKSESSDSFDPRAQFRGGGGGGGGVRFPSKDDVMNERFDISRLSTYELEEIMAVWGNKEEQIQNRLKLKQEVREYAQGRRLSDSDNWTSMGLTDKIGIRRLEKQHYRQEGYEAVLGTQETQRLMALDGLDKDESSPAHPAIRNDVISAIYSTTTQSASLKAHQEAISLQHELEDSNNEKEKDEQQQQQPNETTEESS